MRHQGRSNLHTYPVVRGTKAAYGAASPLTQAARAKGTAFLSLGLRRCSDGRIVVSHGGGLLSPPKGLSSFW